MKMRTFTPECTVQIVHAVLSGEKTVAQVCREHTLADSAVHHWKKLYREKGEAAFTAAAPTASRTSTLSVEEQELLTLRNRVAELERLIGQQTIELSIVQKVQAMTSSVSKNGAK